MCSITRSTVFNNSDCHVDLLRYQRWYFWTSSQLSK